ncbi:two-component response regulator AlgB [Panacagrimonas perspica]|uniref:Two-component response regulator AlgB n=1 Tax=Panacagrimonas perspica TaxID=381431 RepID=A0A4R7P4C2_9GAMM|nr:sigma-54 dependent transcriptional regulator [Panacagrimonas perspica]TDU28292.1 two-component response regulator AlgB [Panacagrimonas perspica]
MTVPLRILVIDDDASIQRAFRRALEEEGYTVVTAQSAIEAEAAIGRGAFDICTLDLNLGEVYGLDLLPRLREWAPWMRVILVTAVDDVKVAMNAVRTGASDYLVKPCTPEQLTHAVDQQAQARRLEKRIESLESDNTAREAHKFTTSNTSLMAQFESARQVAATDATVLLLGESGTGKTALARAIHDWSNRAKAVFATVSCPSLSPELLASELFGHVRGAFTGATDNRQGRVQIADGGTLFLDEIGDLPLAIQPKLLRFIQDHEYERVGDPHTRTANVRIIAATNRDLKKMISEGQFREDLYYRLNVITLTMPPLRERTEDLVSVAEGMLLTFVRQYDRPARRFNEQAVNWLRQYGWPGNLRELRNVVERAVILCNQESIGLEYLPTHTESAAKPGPGLRAGDTVSLEELERAHILAVMSATSTLDNAAKILGIDGSTLYRKRKQYELTKEGSAA